MKKLRKGPELKMPKLKAPAFLADLYYDLRDRRLLPLVALVLVAIVAVPFLLGSKSEEPVLPPAAVATGAGGASGAGTSRLTVVEATPGLRDYRKRLRDRSPTDPFQQRYTGSAGGGSGSSGDASASSSETSSPSNAYSEEAVTTTESSSTTVEVNGGGSSNGGGSTTGGNSGGSSGSAGSPHLIVYDYAIDVRISYSPPEGQDGGQSPEPFVKQRVLPQTPLPGEKAPVVTYMGPGRNGDNKATGKVLLLVSGDVNQISGEHRCMSSGPGVCQLLEVEPGFPLTFAYGDGGANYTIKVLNIELVVVGHS